MRRKAGWAAAACVLLACAVALWLWLAESEKPDFLARLGDAHARGAQDEFGGLIAAYDGDPWRLAGALVLRGFDEAATAYAGQCKGRGADGLVSRTTIWVGMPPAARERIRAALASPATDNLTGIPSYFVARAFLAAGESKEGNTDPDAASAAYRAAERAALAAGWVRGAGDAMLGLAVIASKARGWRASREEFGRAAAHYAAAGARQDSLTTGMSAGRSAMDSGFPGEALAVLEPLDQMAQEDLAVADLKVARGNALTGLQLYGLAQVEYEDALKVYEAAKDVSYQASTLRELGDVLYESGRHADAVDTLRRAMSLYAGLEEEGYSPDDAEWHTMTRSSLGLALIEVHQPDEGLRLIRQARREFAAGDDVDTDGVAKMWIGEGWANFRRGSFDEAVAAFERAEGLYRAKGARGAGPAFAWENLGQAHLAAGRHEVARTYLTRALKRAEALELSRVAARCHEQLARQALQDKRPADALRSCDAAYAQLARVSGGLLFTARGSVTALFRELHQTALQAAVATGNASTCLRVMERARNQGLRLALEGRAGFARALLPPATIAELRAKRLAEAQALSRLKALLVGGEEPAIRRARAVHTAAANDRRRSIEASLRTRTALVTPSAPPRLDRDRLVSRLGADGAFVSLARHAEGWAAVVLMASEIRLIELPEMAKIDKALARLPLDGARFQPPSGLIDELRELVVAPLALEPSIRRVLVSPADAMLRVPFAALLPDSEITYVPSGSMLRALPSRAVGGRAPSLAVARIPDAPEGKLPALVHSGREADALKAQVTLMGKHATVAELRKKLSAQPSWDVVHFATHAVIDSRRPMDSYLVLSAAIEDPGDFKLTVGDVLALPVPAALVVLSGCRTARGSHFHGEGRIGFSRAFMLAGARSVLVSLWRVPDKETADFMTVFHLERRKGANSAAALHRVQRVLRERGATLAAWAGWQLWLRGVLNRVKVHRHVDASVPGDHLARIDHNCDALLPGSVPTKSSKSSRSRYFRYFPYSGSVLHTGIRLMQTSTESRTPGSSRPRGARHRMTPPRRAMTRSHCTLRRLTCGAFRDEPTPTSTGAGAPRSHSPLPRALPRRRRAQVADPTREPHLQRTGEPTDDQFGEAAAASAQMGAARVLPRLARTKKQPHAARHQTRRMA